MSTPGRLAIVSALLVVGVGAAACSSTPALTGKQLVQETQNAVQQARSVHYVDTTIVGTQAQVATGSVSATQAQVDLTAQGHPLLMARLVGTTLYFWSSSATVIENSLGLTATQAASAVNQWISLASSDQPFGTILASMSISSEVDAYIPNTKDPISVGAKRKLAGKAVIPLSQATGSSKAAEDLTLFISPTTHLPAAGAAVGRTKTATESKQAIFDDWNNPVTVSAPTGATSYSVISGG
jgi:hypothetical protein